MTEKQRQYFVPNVPAEGWAGSPDFWATVRAVRTYRGMTQAEMARRMGLSASYLSYVEDGKRKTTVEMVDGVCDVLEMTVVELEEAKKWLAEVGK